jgi:hypothetical protein
MGLSLGLKLLGIGRAILGFFLGVLKGIFEFCQKHPMLALALFVDIVLLYGCWWGYKQHNISENRGAKIVQLEHTIKEKDSLIEMLYKRVAEYAAALKTSQDGRVADIEQHNREVLHLQQIGDEQLAEAQKRAELTKKQRDAYFALSEKYRRVLSQGGNLTPAERIAREEQINAEFIRDMQGVRK